MKKLIYSNYGFMGYFNLYVDFDKEDNVQGKYEIMFPNIEEENEFKLDVEKGKTFIDIMNSIDFMSLDENYDYDEEMIMDASVEQIFMIDDKCPRKSEWKTGVMPDEIKPLFEAFTLICPNIIEYIKLD